MNAERLRLPEPAGTLWKRIREPLKRALGSRGAPTELKLGGGTVLAARWEHRKSHDIDIVVPEKTNLWTYGAALDDAMTALGADKYGYSPKRKQYRAAFTEGSASLGPRAGEAILSRMYARIAVAVEDGRIVATTTTAGGTTRRHEWTADEAAERFRTSGLDAALSGMRQDAERIRDAATAATQAGRNEQIADCGTLT